MHFAQRWIDSFKPAESAHEISMPEIDMDGEPEKKGAEVQLAYPNDSSPTGTITENNTKSSLKRSIKPRHLMLMAIGTGIGTGLFIGSGATLSQGGPGFVLIDYTLIGMMILTVIMAIAELSSVLPVPGPFSHYVTRFIDPGWGFAVGYNYLMMWLATFPLEFTAATLIINFWNTDEQMPKGALIAIFWVFIIVVNLFGARGYVEVEFMTTSFKMLTIIGFIICSIVIDCGGAPNKHYLGAGTFYNPGAFNNGFKGFCSVFVTAAFAYTGTELVGFAAAESSNPRKYVPKACKLVLYRIGLFYVLALLMVTLLVPYDTPELHGENSYDPNSSPFVLAIQKGQIKVLPHILNAIIMLSALSVSNSAAYAASRSLHALAEQRLAPRIFTYVDRSGRPLVASAVTLLFGLLGFLVYASNEGEIFSWLLGISGLSVIFLWGSVCAAHIRFRLAWKRQGHSLTELPWASPFGIYGSIIGLVFNIFIVALQFYLSLFPIKVSAKGRVYQFFLGMISLPIILMFFLGYKFIKRDRGTKRVYIIPAIRSTAAVRFPKLHCFFFIMSLPFVVFFNLGKAFVLEILPIPLDEIDLVTGICANVSPEIKEQEEAEARAKPIWSRIFDVLF